MSAAMICKTGLVFQIVIGPLNQWHAVGGVCGVKTCKGSNTESDCVTWCVKSSWLRQRKRRLRLELRVAPQIAQVANNDLVPACLGEKEEEVWRRWGGGRGGGSAGTGGEEAEDEVRQKWGTVRVEMDREVSEDPAQSAEHYSHLHDLKIKVVSSHLWDWSLRHSSEASAVVLCLCLICSIWDLRGKIAFQTHYVTTLFLWQELIRRVRDSNSFSVGICCTAGCFKNVGDDFKSLWRWKRAEIT